MKVEVEDEKKEENRSARSHFEKWPFGRLHASRFR
jgi:hypothetical protein